MKYVYRPNPTGGGRIGHTKGFTYHRRLLPKSPGKMRLALMLPQYEIPWRAIFFIFLGAVAVSGMLFAGLKTKSWVNTRRQANEVAALAEAQSQLKQIKESIKNQLKTPQEATKYGQQKQNEGNLKEAQAAFEIATELQPDWRDALLCLGQVYLMQKNYDGAESVLNHALSLDPIYPTTHDLLSILYGKTGRKNESGLALKKADDLAKKMGLEIGG